MKKCQVVLLGNHDQAVLTGPANFHPVAEQAIRWTQGQLADPEGNGRLREFLRGLPPRHGEGDLLFVHGSPRDPVNEYILPESQGNMPLMLDLFSRVERCCFSGHTHLPGVFTRAFEFLSPPQLTPAYRLGVWKTLCNVGSVGQPRDGDWRACYALFDGEAIHFRRVEYDVEATVRKIRATKGLDEVLGERLLVGC
jgi:diadenosine tetraphosphatase ApaH/serine/threonine PP2A family protein phosphatase